MPGIGTFSIDPTVTVPDISDKLFTEFLQQIKFEQKNILTADDDFIDFIRTETGKIRPLAESDLDSFLTDGKILLNIGKPFLIEGIGSLLKNREGAYVFTPGSILPSTRLEIANPETITDNKRKSVFTEDSYQPSGTRKLIIAGSVIIGIVLVIWLGYSLYNRSANNTVAVIPIPQTADTARANIILDSAQKLIDSAIERTQIRPSGSYKFIIEKTASKTRAFKRYNQLKDNRDNIRMESLSDSTLFHLYLIISATPGDTSRIRDSLKNWYGRNQVFIE